MKLGLNVLLAGVLAAALLVPAAEAKPGNGNGSEQGHGPPAWAGAGSGGAKASGKPPWAGKGQDKKAEKTAQKAARRATRTSDDEEPADALKHDNPAWVCKFEREQTGAEAFAERYGTDDGKSNAFGKCVSREARDRDGVTTGDGETPEPASEESTGNGDAAERDSEGADAFAAFWAFLHAFSALVL